MNEENKFHQTAIDELQSRIDGMKHSLVALASNKREVSEEALSPNDVLCIRERKCLDIELSTGSPADWVRVYVENGCVSDVEYHYAEWFKHEEVNLSPGEYETIVAWSRDVLMVGAQYDRQVIAGTDRRL